MPVFEPEVIACLGLGTNLGDREVNLGNAIRSLSRAPGIRLARISSVYSTEPWGVKEQPSFLNCVAEVETSLGPEALLAACQAVEQDLGRVPGPRWGPRLIDVDILLYGDRVVGLPHLEIPHPRLHLRAFALVPLAELNPMASHPVLRRTVGELARNVDGLDGVTLTGRIDLALEKDDC